MLQHMHSLIPHGGPLWVWVATVNASLVLEFLRLDESLKLFLRCHLIHSLATTMFDGQ